MSLLLCGKRAKVPFYYEKLNIRLYSLEEAAYCIRRYPLITVDGLVNENFADWVRTQGLSQTLAEELAQGLEQGESTENLLLKVVQTANFMPLAEIRALSSLLAGFRNMIPWERLRLTGKMYFDSGRLKSAYEKFGEALTELTKENAGRSDELETEIGKADRADLICDMVAVSMLRFDKKEAVRLLDSIGSAGRYRRAEEYRYLITGDAVLSEEEKNALKDRKRRLEMSVRQSRKIKKLKELSTADYAEFSKAAAQMLTEWKRDYRRTT